MSSKSRHLFHIHKCLVEKFFRTLLIVTTFNILINKFQARKRRVSIIIMIIVYTNTELLQSPYTTNAKNNLLSNPFFFTIIPSTTIKIPSNISKLIIFGNICIQKISRTILKFPNLKLNITIKNLNNNTLTSINKIFFPIVEIRIFISHSTIFINLLSYIAFFPKNMNKSHRIKTVTIHNAFKHVSCKNLESTTVCQKIAVNACTHREIRDLFGIHTKTLLKNFSLPILTLLTTKINKNFIKITC